MSQPSSPPVRIILVRHGESTYNVEKRIQGRSDAAELTLFGIQQAEAVRQAFGKLCFHGVYASPLRRAWRTAETIVRDTGLTIEACDLLREVDVSEWEGLTFTEVKTQHAADYELWHHHPEQLQLSGRFPIHDLWQNAQAFWQFLAAKVAAEDTSGQTVINVLVVGHSGINRALIATALGLECNHYHHLGQDNCAISVLNFAQGWGSPPQLESLNLTGHLGEALPKSKGGLRLLLIRHGETQWNREQRFQGQMDIPLNELGVWQAEQVALFLKNQTIDCAFSSPLQRPWATAKAICQFHPHLDLQSIPALAEISHGDWEGKLQGEIESSYPGLLSQWQNQPQAVQMPGGENLEQVWQRTNLGWQEVVAACAAQAGTTAGLTTGLVVAHDATNKAIICQILGLDPSAFWYFKQGNAAVTVIDYPEGATSAAVLRSLNITSHFGQGVLDCTAAGAL